MSTNTPATGLGSRCPRRRFLGGLGAACAAPWVLRGADGVGPAAAFDARLEDFMRRRRTPGGAVAVVKDRRLVYARGYGWADREGEVAATPETLFRVASVSKPITAAAILQLVERGRLDLETRVFTLLDLEARLEPEDRLDDRWRRVTIRHLLHHTGGWDRDRSGDPMFVAQRTLARRSPDLPEGSPWRVIRHQLARPLDFDPGARYAYSNFGYCLLGRVIEKLEGRSYEAFVREATLAPAGIRRMRLGRSREDQRAEGEARYYTSDPPDPAKEGGTASRSGAYGAFNLEAMDAHGGWIASVVDLARFAAALDGPDRCPLLRPATLALLREPPAPPVARRPDGSLEPAYYGCGWMVRPVPPGSGANFWHAGSLPGTYAFLMRLANGLSMAVVFNRRSEDPKLPDADVDPLLHQAARAVTAWPAEDLFGRYG